MLSQDNLISIQVARYIGTASADAYMHSKIIPTMVNVVANPCGHGKLHIRKVTHMQVHNHNPNTPYGLLILLNITYRERWTPNTNP